MTNYTTNTGFDLQKFLTQLSVGVVTGVMGAGGVSIYLHRTGAEDGGAMAAVPSAEIQRLQEEIHEKDVDMAGMSWRLANLDGRCSELHSAMDRMREQMRELELELYRIKPKP